MRHLWICLALLFAATVHANQVLMKNESGTLRETASTKGKALATLTQFTPVTVLEAGPEWTKVKTNAGQTGFVMTRLLSKVGFVSTEDDKVNVYRGPSREYAIIMNYGRNFPLRVLDVASNGFLKVMDFEGDRGWVSPKSVVASPVYVITKEPQVNVRQQPGVDSSKVFSAEKGVILQALEEKEGWLNVKHPDGDTGWVSAKIMYGWLDVDDPSTKKAEAAAAPGKSDKPEAAAASEKASTKSETAKSGSKSSGSKAASAKSSSKATAGKSTTAKSSASKSGSSKSTTSQSTSKKTSSKASTAKSESDE